MEVGFRVFEIAKSSGYPLYRGAKGGYRQAIEVFPHASAVVLRGNLPAKGVSKQVWRRKTLVDASVDTTGLNSEDELDAALCALTGVRFLQGRSCVVGEPGQAVLVLPSDRLSALRYVRESGFAREPTKSAVIASASGEMFKCLCGCDALAPASGTHGYQSEPAGARSTDSFPSRPTRVESRWQLLQARGLE